MTVAVDLIRQAEAEGVHLEIEGGEVYASGALTEDIVNRLRAHKGELFAELVAARHGLTITDLRALAGPDWPEVERDPALLEALAGADWSELEAEPGKMEAFANMVSIRKMRERGEVPAHYTASTICAHCGPVPIFPGVRERVLGCPWCLNRAAGRPVPRAQA